MLILRQIAISCSQEVPHQNIATEGNLSKPQKRKRDDIGCYDTPQFVSLINRRHITAQKEE